jgi:hypothetical protein
MPISRRTMLSGSAVAGAALALPRGFRYDLRFSISAVLANQDGSSKSPTRSASSTIQLRRRPKTTFPAASASLRTGSSYPQAGAPSEGNAIGIWEDTRDRTRWRCSRSIADNWMLSAVR